MAATMIPFPRRSEQTSSEIEQVIRKWLNKISADYDLVNHVTERMLVFINQYACKTFEPAFNLPAPANMSAKEADAMLLSIQEGVDQAAEQVQEMINRIIVERFFLEIELYELARNEKKVRLKRTH